MNMETKRFKNNEKLNSTEIYDNTFEGGGN